MEGETIYWDDFLQARVTIHESGPQGVIVQLVDEPGVQLEQWGQVRPVPGAVLWSSWENLKKLVLN